jgi:hypothetical protein
VYTSTLATSTYMGAKRLVLTGLRQARFMEIIVAFLALRPIYSTSTVVALTQVFRKRGILEMTLYTHAVFVGSRPAVCMIR